MHVQSVMLELKSDLEILLSSVLIGHPILVILKIFLKIDLSDREKEIFHPLVRSA